MTNIQLDLFNMRDEKYAEFSAKLLPEIPHKNIIGVRTPELKKYARTISSKDFIKKLPHKYFEENQLHAFILSQMRDFEQCIQLVDEFLPHINNWATCDQLLPRIFAKHTDKLFEYIQHWIKSEHTYTVRFAIGELMRFYLGDKFKPLYANMVVNINSNEYYINMMRAWYFATALAKNYEEILPYIENKNLDKWTHNKTIQKALESYRIDNTQKEYLRKLKIKQ